MLIPDFEIDRLLTEDAPFGDLTTRVLEVGERDGRISFFARSSMVVCATEEAARLFERLGATVESQAPSGSRLKSGSLLLAARGRAGALLLGWKVAQTLVETTSGIATEAAALVDAARVERPEVVVACTRKTFPGTRTFAIKGILAGGAQPHRLGLSESVLIFPEHRLFAAGLGLVDLVTRAKFAAPERKIVVEVESVPQALEAAHAGADVLQLERFQPRQVREVVAATRQSRVLVAAAGGVNVRNAADYAAAGADLLVSSAPYWAQPRDVKVIFEALEQPAEQPL
jgi:molybdenum transport protein